MECRRLGNRYEQLPGGTDRHSANFQADPNAFALQDRKGPGYESEESHLVFGFDSCGINDLTKLRAFEVYLD